MKHTSSHSTKGFTLIEILVSIAILGIMAGIGISMFAIINKTVQKAETINRIQSEGSAVIETIQRSIRSSTNTSSTGCWIPQGGAAAEECLHLELPPDSIEYQEAVDGTGQGCKYVDYYYDHVDGMGRIIRIRYNDKSSEHMCGTWLNLFSDRGRGGINVQKVAGSNIFNRVDPQKSPAYITISFILSPGVQFKDKDTEIPFITTTSLRDYTR